jgi:hypothetical protein
MCRSLTLTAVVFALVPLHAGAVTITLDTVDRGVYYSTGEHYSTDLVYFVGDGGSFGNIRSFFVFDLSALNPGDVINGARLHLFNSAAGYGSSDPFEIFSIYDVTTPITDLTADSLTDTPIFDDLGTGTTYRGLLITTADAGAFVDVPLNPLGIADLTAGIGSLFAFGGALDSISGGEVLFFGGGQGQPMSNTQLILDVTPFVVPLPPALWLLGGSLGTLIATCRRRRTS